LHLSHEAQINLMSGHPFIHNSGKILIEKILNIEERQTQYQQIFRMISSCEASKNRLLFIDFRTVLL
jgi:hypothetical protein